MARTRQDAVSTTDVVIDESVYPRSAFNELHVKRLMDALDAGGVFPPIVVEQGTNRLVDGRHRLEVYLRKELPQIPAIRRVYASEADLFADAVKSNAEHGAGLTYYDIKVSIQRLQDYGYTVDRISAVVKLLPGKITEIIKGFAQDVDGGAVPLKGGLRHKRGQLLSHSQVQAVRKYGGGQVVFYIRQLMSLLDNDMWPEESAVARTEMDNLAARWNARSKEEAA